jgi:hypothetical protein
MSKSRSSGNSESESRVRSTTENKNKFVASLVEAILSFAPRFPAPSRAVALESSERQVTLKSALLFFRQEQRCSQLHPCSGAWRISNDAVSGDRAL